MYFKPEAYTENELERIKLEDGVRVHKAAKVDFETYADQTEEKKVKPFVLMTKDVSMPNAAFMSEVSIWTAVRYRNHDRRCQRRGCDQRTRHDAK